MPSARSIENLRKKLRDLKTGLKPKRQNITVIRADRPSNMFFRVRGNPEPVAIENLPKKYFPEALSFFIDELARPDYQWKARTLEIFCRKFGRKRLEERDN